MAQPAICTVGGRSTIRQAWIGMHRLFRAGSAAGSGRLAAAIDRDAEGAEPRAGTIGGAGEHHAAACYRRSAAAARGVVLA